MSHKKILELAYKFAHTLENPRAFETYQAKKERLERFSHIMVRQMGSILNEMENDLFTLKMKKFDKEMWKIFATVWNNLLNIKKEINPTDPYKIANKIISFVKTRPNKPVLDNLEFLIQHHLKQTEVPLPKMEELQQAQVRSIKLLKQFVKELEAYMKQYPEVDLSGSYMGPQIDDGNSEPLLPNSEEQVTMVGKK